MAKAERLARLDERRIELETDYRAALVAALEITAAGRSGLFGHNPKDRPAREAAAPVVAALIEMGEEIDAIRARLQLDRFGLHAEFLGSRGPVAPSALGEPKQAQKWLAKILP